MSTPDIYVDLAGCFIETAGCEAGAAWPLDGEFRLLGDIPDAELLLAARRLLDECLALISCKEAEHGPEDSVDFHAARRLLESDGLGTPFGVVNRARLWEAYQTISRFCLFWRSL